MPLIYEGIGEKGKSQYNDFYGVFIGIENFPHSDGAIPNLMYSNEDADNVCRFFFDSLVENPRADTETKLSLFVNEPYIAHTNYHDAVQVEQGSRVNILRCLSNYLNVADSDDLLLVYVSTHGEIDYNDYFFIPTDGEFDNILGTGISSNTMVQALGKAASRGVYVILIIDTCYSGAISFDLGKYEGEFACLMSASPVEYAYEYTSLKQSVFTHFLLDGLNGSAPSTSLIDVFEYVYKQVQVKTKKRQNPLLTGTMKYEFKIV